MPLGITPGTEGIGPVSDGGRYGQVLENIQESKKPKEEPGGLLGFLNNIFKSNGGAIPQAAQGGWISGPQSGYPVSLDGGDQPRSSDMELSMLLERQMGSFRRSF